MPRLVQDGCLRMQTRAALVRRRLAHPRSPPGPGMTHERVAQPARWRVSRPMT